MARKLPWLSEGRKGLSAASSTSRPAKRRIGQALDEPEVNNTGVSTPKRREKERTCK
jgi:hypothetical protein